MWDSIAGGLPTKEDLDTSGQTSGLVSPLLQPPVLAYASRKAVVLHVFYCLSNAMQVKVVTQIYLDANISKMVRDSGSVPMDNK